MKKTVCLIVAFSLLFLFRFIVHAGEINFVADAGDVCIGREVRLWTLTGEEQNIEAVLVEVSQNGQTITLQKTNGTESSIELEKLSVEDREFVRSKHWECRRGVLIDISEDGETVTLWMTDDTQREVPLTALTKASQEYVLAEQRDYYRPLNALLKANREALGVQAPEMQTPGMQPGMQESLKKQQENIKQQRVCPGGVRRLKFPCGFPLQRSSCAGGQKGPKPVPLDSFSK